jgi:hypothetical protein
MDHCYISSEYGAAHWARYRPFQRNIRVLDQVEALGFTPAIMTFVSSLMPWFFGERGLGKVRQTSLLLHGSLKPPFGERAP